MQNGTTKNENPQIFKDKVALVTGASSGIGKAIALALATCGASVTLCGRNVERLDASVEECVRTSAGHSERFIPVTGDVTDASFRTKAVEGTIAKFGRLDVLVCNAGFSSAGDDIQSATEDVFDSLISVNLKSVFFLIQAALPHLERSKGNVVNVSSVTSGVASKPIIYASTKASLDHMTHCLALDLAPRGVRVNSINPSFVVTRVFRDLGEEASNNALLALGEIEKRKQPLQGRLVTLEELAKGVLFLASDSASFVTGQNLAIDGARGLMGSFP